MKNWKYWEHLVITIILIIAMVYCCAYAYITFQGKDIVLDWLREVTQRKVSMSYFDLNPPFILNISNLTIEGAAKIGDLKVSISIPHLLTGNLVFNDLIMVRPEFVYVKNPPAPEVISTTTQPLKAATRKAINSLRNKQRPLRLYIKRLNIKDGVIDFTDNTASSEGIKIKIKDLNLDLTNLYTFTPPFSTVASFQLKGKIPWQQGEEEGKVQAEGWLNIYKKDMQASLIVEKIDGVYLYPYYSPWMPHLQEAGVERAKLSLNSDIQSLNNRMFADCHLELTDIVRKKRPSPEPVEKAEKLRDTVLDIFTAEDGKAQLDFTIKTHMDKPDFLMVPIIKSAVEQKIYRARRDIGVTRVEDILTMPVRIGEGLIKGAANMAKAVVSGAFGMGKVIKDGVMGPFKTQPPESKQTTNEKTN